MTQETHLYVSAVVLHQWYAKRILAFFNFDTVFQNSRTCRKALILNGRYDEIFNEINAYGLFNVSFTSIKYRSVKMLLQIKYSHLLWLNCSKSSIFSFYILGILGNSNNEFKYKICNFSNSIFLWKPNWKIIEI